MAYGRSQAVDVGEYTQRTSGHPQAVHIHYINYGYQNIANGGPMNNDNRHFPPQAIPQSLSLPPYNWLNSPEAPTLAFPTPQIGLSNHAGLHEVEIRPSQSQSMGGSDSPGNIPTNITKPLSAIHFEDKDGKHIRIYSQDHDLNIVEMFYDSNRGGSGWNERQQYVIGRGRLNTGLAATCWKGGNEIRIYYIDINGTMVERAYSGGGAGAWYNGGMTGRFLPAPYSKLAAFNFESKRDREIRIFYQDLNNKIQEATFKKGQWSVGTHTLPVALPGTNIAATGGAEKMWVYAQMPDLSIKESCYQGGWRVGGFTSNRSYAAGAPMAVVVRDNYHIRVFTTDDTKSICLTQWNGRWDGSFAIGSSARMYTGLAAISIAGGGFPGNSLRLYFQSVEAEVTELATYDGNTWKAGNQKIRIPNKIN
ncbi:fucose-specific lectin [Pluteus cervinus]|uniref:Fucose-specific lectin n=1 Tax=Pluteus cervinus TaxID=181527 RepID=A0ACD3AID1_9AGAR|nr:fucose-specific lectin [Pluteus cervinus]